MVIPGQLIEVKITKRNCEHYKKLGYDIQPKDVIMVPPEHLTIGSHEKIQIECDVCGILLTRDYKTYISHRKYGFDTCCKCKSKKSVITNRERYGCDNPTQSLKIQDKIQKTMLERYGVEHAAQSRVFREKMKTTTFSRYGVEYAAQSDVVKQQMRDTCVDKYGVSHFSQTLMYKEQMAKTCQERYGSDTPFQSIEILNKAKQTLRERYGVENPIQIPEVREKIRHSLTKNGTGKVSKQQIQMHQIIQQKYSNAELNYPFSTCSLDVYVCIDDTKIDVEYDGWYWHQDKWLDVKRDKFLQSHGFKTLRIRSGTMLPTEQELFDAIDELVNTNKVFKEIILPDWKEVDKNESLSNSTAV